MGSLKIIKINPVLDNQEFYLWEPEHIATLLRQSNPKLKVEIEDAVGGKKIEIEPPKTGPFEYPVLKEIYLSPPIKHRPKVILTLLEKINHARKWIAGNQRLKNEILGKFKKTTGDYRLASPTWVKILYNYETREFRLVYSLFTNPNVEEYTSTHCRILKEYILQTQLV